MKINLKKLIKTRELDRTEVARILFPSNAHPSQALTRILSGRSTLREGQIYRLAMYVGLSIDALYEDSLQWKISPSQELIRFSRGDYSAIYSSATGITKIYLLEKMCATHVLSKPNQPLSEYFAEINRIVINISIKTAP